LRTRLRWTSFIAAGEGERPRARLCVDGGGRGGGESRRNGEGMGKCRVRVGEKGHVFLFVCDPIGRERDNRDRPESQNGVQ